jgi:hypothetical protein
MASVTERSSPTCPAAEASPPTGSASSRLAGGVGFPFPRAGPVGQGGSQMGLPTRRSVDAQPFAGGDELHPGQSHVRLFGPDDTGSLDQSGHDPAPNFTLPL